MLQRCTCTHLKWSSLDPLALSCLNMQRSGISMQQGLKRAAGNVESSVQMATCQLGGREQRTLARQQPPLIGTFRPRISPMESRTAAFRYCLCGRKGAACRPECWGMTSMRLMSTDKMHVQPSACAHLVLMAVPAIAMGPS